MAQKPEVGKILQCDECKQEKIIRAASFYEKRGWVRFCLECFQSLFGKNLEGTREIVLKPEEFCGKHDRPKKIWKQGKSGKLEAHCLVCDREEWIKSLEHLHFEPLKIAKFLYKMGADTWPVIQKLVSLAYIKGLKQKKLLFEEKYEKWGGDLILISLYEKSTNGIYPLSPATVLKNIEEPTESFVRNLLTDIYQNCDYYEEEERRLNLVIAKLLQLTEEEGTESEKIYPWQEKEKYIHSYAS